MQIRSQNMIEQYTLIENSPWILFMQLYFMYTLIEIYSNKTVKFKSFTIGQKFEHWSIVKNKHDRLVSTW